MQAALKADDGENWHGSFLKAKVIGTWFHPAGCRYALHGLQVQGVAGFDSD
jgi:hypothetical protein